MRGCGGVVGLDGFIAGSLSEGGELAQFLVREDLGGCAVLSIPRITACSLLKSLSSEKSPDRDDVCLFTESAPLRATSLNEVDDVLQHRRQSLTNMLHYFSLTSSIQQSEKPYNN